MEATLNTDHLRLFLTVLAAGSFTRAANLAGSDKAHVSRIIARLEDQLGTRLLNRSTRSLSPTDAGRELAVRARAILDALAETEDALKGRADHPRGRLRITCGYEFGLLAVNGWVRVFLDRWPEVSVEVDFTNRVADIVYEGFDLAIRVGRMADSDLIAHKLCEVSYGFYAAPSFVTAHGAPRHPAELVADGFIGFTGSPAEVVRGTETCALPARPRYLANTNMAVRDMAVAGLGIALLPRFQATPFVTTGSLTPVLSGWTRQPVEVHAVMATRRRMSALVRAFLDVARTAKLDGAEA
ncbi:MAG: LysR family transcriptional regulator [Paracoccaceae bacterium]|nr:MAG: LysR family transcriptional regulator [Paracoccaceae bacterium]